LAFLFRYEGIVEANTFQTNEKGTYEIEIPLIEKYSPSVSLRVDLQGAIHRKDTEGQKRTDSAIPPVCFRLNFSSFRLTLVRFFRNQQEPKEQLN